MRRIHRESTHYQTPVSDFNPAKSSITVPLLADSTINSLNLSSNSIFIPILLSSNSVRNTRSQTSIPIISTISNNSIPLPSFSVNSSSACRRSRRILRKNAEKMVKNLIPERPEFFIYNRCTDIKKSNKTGKKSSILRPKSINSIPILLKSHGISKPTSIIGSYGTLEPGPKAPEARSAVITHCAPGKLIINDPERQSASPLQAGGAATERRFIDDQFSRWRRTSDSSLRSRRADRRIFGEFQSMSQMQHFMNSRFPAAGSGGPSGPPNPPPSADHLYVTHDTKQTKAAENTQGFPQPKSPPRPTDRRVDSFSSQNLPPGNFSIDAKFNQYLGGVRQ